MNLHEFLFTPGIWIGEGKITFSHSPDFIKFYTKWDIQFQTDLSLKLIQAIEMQGIEEHNVNVFYIEPISDQTFSIHLENALMGKIKGHGIIEPKTLAWEFRDHHDFEGFEVYELQENGDYFFHAEYASHDQYRTIVEGLIWKKQ